MSSFSYTCINDDQLLQINVKVVNSVHVLPLILVSVNVNNLSCMVIVTPHTSHSGQL